MVYKWNKYAYPISADIVGKHFEKLEKKHGQLNREIVLESARPEKSPIHDLFEWNDSVAAENYRLHQATLLICNLDVVTEKEDEKPIICRAYVNVTDERKGSFLNTTMAFQNEDTKNIVLNRAYRELKAFEEKYRNLKEFADLISVIDQMMAKVG